MSKDQTLVRVGRSSSMLFYLLLPLVVGFLLFLALFLSTSNNDLLTIAYSFLLVVPFAAIALFTDIDDVFSPLKIIAYILIISSPVFAVYVYYIADGWKADYAVFWQPFEDLIPGITLIAVAMISLVMGYFLDSRNLIRRRNRESDEEFNANNVRAIAFVGLFLSVLASIFYALDVNYASSLQENVLSRKSVHESTVGISVRGSALTHWRLLGISLPHAIMIVYCSLIWLRKIRVTKKDFVILLLLFFSSSIIPFIASSRTPIIEIGVILLMIRHYLVKSVNMPKMLAFGLAGLVLLGTLGELRRNPGELAVASIGSSFEQVIGASYFIDLGKTSVVVNRVPTEVDYLYGTSLTSIFFAVIPRQIWPEKPVVRIGYFVGQQVIGLNNQTGIPPGFIAEMYMNFGYVGIFPMFLLIGYLVRRLYRNLQERKSVVSVITYVVGIVTVSLSLLATDLTYALFQAIVYSVPIALMLRFTRVKNLNA